MNKIKIISDGTSFNTKVFCNDTELGYISKIEIEPIEKDTLVLARLTFESVQLDMDTDLKDIIVFRDRPSVGCDTCINSKNQLNEDGDIGIHAWDFCEDCNRSESLEDNYEE